MTETLAQIFKYAAGFGAGFIAWFMYDVAWLKLKHIEEIDARDEYIQGQIKVNEVRIDAIEQAYGQRIDQNTQDIRTLSTMLKNGRLSDDHDNSGIGWSVYSNYAPRYDRYSGVLGLDSSYSNDSEMLEAKRCDNSQSSWAWFNVSSYDELLLSTN